MPLKNLSDVEILGVVATFSGFCGSLHYLLKVQEGKAFYWRELLLHCAISSVCGLISYEILNYQGFPPQLCGALAGLSGWGGTRIIKIAEIVIAKRLGVTKEDMKE